MSRKVTGTSDSTARRMYGSSSNFSNYAQDNMGPMANSPPQEQMRSLSRNPSYSENGMERQRKNSIRQKFPKIQNFFGNINAKARLDQPPRDPCHTMNEYENCADIPFSHIFVDEGEPDNHNDSNKSSTSSMNNGGGSSMDLRRTKGLKHSSTLPPMSEHQRMSYMEEMGKHKSNRKKECQAQTIGRNSSRLAAVMETERQPNAVFEVLKKGIELRDKPQETPDAEPKSGFYFGDLDEEDEQGDGVDCGSYNRGNFESCLQASHSRRNLRNPQLATGGASSSSLKNIKKLTLTKICDKFKKLKHQPSVESSNSENEVVNSRNGNSKLKPKTSNGDLMKMKRNDTLYVALYNFDPIEHDDLLLRSGDFIRVVNTRNESWWLGERGKRAGYFPSNYVMKREPHDKALLCKKTLQVHSVDDASTWTLKRSQIVLVDGTHYKTDKSDHIYVRTVTEEGYVPRLHMSLIDQ